MSTRRRYVRIRFGKPDSYHPVGRGFQVTDLNTGKRIEMEIPERYADAFWRAQPGERLRATVFGLRDGRHFVQRRRGRIKVATERVIFRFVEIVPVTEAA